MYLADMLFSSRRLNFSRPQMLAVLEFARQCGGEDVPSLSALQTLQEQLKSRIGNPEQRHVSRGGTVYYVNKISESLKQVSHHFAVTLKWRGINHPFIMRRICRTRRFDPICISFLTLMGSECRKLGTDTKWFMILTIAF
jgi:hypothetical protein